MLVGLQKSEWGGGSDGGVISYHVIACLPPGAILSMFPWTSNTSIRPDSSNLRLSMSSAEEDENRFLFSTHRQEKIIHQH